MTFTYNHNTHVISDDLPKSVTSERAAHWVSRDLIAWNLPDERAGFSYRLYWAAEGGLVGDNGTITGGSSVPLQLDAAGFLSRSVGSSRTWPPLRRSAFPPVSGAGFPRTRPGRSRSPRSTSPALL